MNKILILSLGTTKDILNCAHTCALVREEYPHSEIHVLTYKSHQSRTRLINNVSQFHFIDREKVKQIIEGQVFSNGTALDTFFKGIENVIDSEWTRVINQSNDNVSAYLASCLNTDDIVGASITEKGSAHLSDDWNIVLNNINARPDLRNTIEGNVLQAHSLGFPWRAIDNCLKINPDYAAISGQNFARIRSLKTNNPQIVGINLSLGYDGTCLSESCAEELLSTITENPRTIPVLLIDAQNNEQKEIVNRLNAKFDNSLVSINTDLNAIPAVLPHIDVFVSPANDQLVIANLLNVDSIELRQNEKFRVDPVVTSENSRVLYYRDETSLTSDILINIAEIIDVELAITTLESAGSTYLTVTDDYGYFYTQVRGQIDLRDELNYHFGRSIFFNILGYPENTDLITNVKQSCHSDDLKVYVDELRGELTAVVKVLLASLRSLKTIRNSNQNLNSFLTYYDQLLAYASQRGIVGNLVSFTEGRIENISSETAEENLVQIEKALFELKTHLQKLTVVCSSLLEGESDSKQVEDRT